VKGVCVLGFRLDDIVVGSGGSDAVTCGSGVPCLTLDFALHSRVNKGGNVNVTGTVTLGSDADITGITLQGIGGIQTVTVIKSVTLSFAATSVGTSSNILNILFNIVASAITNTFLLISSNGFSNTVVNITNVGVNYRPALNSPLISIDNIILNLNGFTLERISTTTTTVAHLNNADETICATRSNNPGMLLSGVTATFIGSSFKNINTGALVVAYGNLTLNNVTFANNYAVRQSAFPSLRHNIFAFNRAEINVVSVFTDTGDSLFIYTSENCGCVVNNVGVPLFVPIFTSAQPSTLSSGSITTFAFTGGSLYPCGLYFNFYRDDISTVQPVPILMNVVDESTAAVQFPL
jgi:hypothetical protein